MKNKRKFYKLSILLLITFSLSSCIFQPQERVVTKIQYKYIIPKKCPRPVKPKLKKFDINQSISSSKNMHILTYDMLELMSYSKSLEATIECYENQINQLQKEVTNNDTKRRAGNK